MAIITKQIQCSYLDYPTQDWCISVYFVGCEHFCNGCHNPELASSKTCDCMTVSYEELEKLILHNCKKHRTRKVCLLGGDPLFLAENRIATKKLLTNKDFDLCIYTGYEYEQCADIKGYEYLKCGKYDALLNQESIKTDNEFILASTNQKIYNYNGECISINGKLTFS